MKKIIAIKVDEDTWRKWKMLNELDNVATEKVRGYIAKLIEEYAWWFEERERIKEGKLNPELSGELAVGDMEIDKVSAKEILSEI